MTRVYEITGPHHKAPDRIIVKLAEGVLAPAAPRDAALRLEPDPALLEGCVGVTGLGWDTLVRDIPEISVRRHLEDASEALAELVQRARKRDPSFQAPRFEDYIEISLPASIPATRLLERFSPTDWPAIEEAYVLSGPVSPPADIVPDHLVAAPVGVGAAAAWREPGGKGEGVIVADVEQGWLLDSKDLAERPYKVGVNHEHQEHGAMVLGVLFAKEDGIAEVLGICRKARPRLFSEWRGSPDNPTWLRADAIAEAAVSVGEGNIVLIEAQTDELLPVEQLSAERAAILTATKAGVIIVEAAGNSGNEIPWLAGDTGAIVVAAANSGPIHDRWVDSSHGDRVTCYGLGSSVLTMDGTFAGTIYLSGTSAAAAMIAGAAACIQGISRKLKGTTLTPDEVRSVLANPAYGTPIFEKVGDADAIGFMPDLAKICQQYFGLP